MSTDLGNYMPSNYLGLPVREAGLEPGEIPHNKGSRKVVKAAKETKAQKRAREKEELQDRQKRFTAVVERQLEIKNGYLLKFPVGLANCLNSANFAGLKELTNSYLFHNCSVNLGFSQDAFFSSAGGDSLVNFFSLVNKFYPDRIMVVHTATAANNKLNASFFFKFTDCKFLYDAVASGPVDPIFRSLFPPARSVSLKRKMRLEGQPPEAIENMQSLVESNNDLVVYGSFHMQMEIQEITEKIIGLYIVGSFTSAHPAPTPAPEIPIQRTTSDDIDDLFGLGPDILNPPAAVPLRQK
uniref:Uncharacterized protein n=1 Tax=Spumella elongata TaxID=89044 RepID=A0A7S3MET4_9STRA|mmetsp:Transcript_57561/g.101144  ORF Transcript_57561/g.101144 Transcript_57561/m.101144 type:complete len:297 (+) Transcript_57561:40-930(+)